MYHIPYSDNFLESETQTYILVFRGWHTFHCHFYTLHEVRLLTHCHHIKQKYQCSLAEYHSYILISFAPRYYNQTAVSKYANHVLLIFLLSLLCITILQNFTNLLPMLVGRAHLARQYASCRESSLGGASADARSYWQGRFAACAFVDFSFGIGRPWNSWGVAPSPTRGAASGLRKGHCPLTLSAAPQLGFTFPTLGLSGFIPFQCP